MCQYCWDLDDYEARHGHTCDDDCAGDCELCGEPTCAYETITLASGDVVCYECSNKADDEEDAK